MVCGKLLSPVTAGHIVLSRHYGHQGHSNDVWLILMQANSAGFRRFYGRLSVSDLNDGGCNHSHILL